MEGEFLLSTIRQHYVVTEDSEWGEGTGRVVNDELFICFVGTGGMGGVVNDVENYCL